MNIQELATAVQYELPVKIAILNNRCLGMVRQWQELFYKKRYSHSTFAAHPDFVKLAEAYGAVGLRATKPEEVVSVIKKALASRTGPVIMDFVVDTEECVYPMVPAGAPIKQYDTAVRLRRGRSLTGNDTMRHTISVLVDNRPGVLSRIAGLFSGRGFNIESLSVNETLDPTMSQMTIVTRGDDRILEQITKQLNKLIDIIKVIDYESSDYFERELALIKVNVDELSAPRSLSIIDIFRCKVVDVSRTHYTVEVTGDENKIRQSSICSGLWASRRLCARARLQCCARAKNEKHKQESHIADMKPRFTPRRERGPAPHDEHKKRRLHAA